MDSWAGADLSDDVRDAIERKDWFGALLILGNRNRPEIIVYMLELGMLGSPEFGEVLRKCWGHDPDQHFLRARLGRRRLIGVMRAQRFPHPFTAPISVYRGEDVLEPRCRVPCSWTTSPACAAWFTHYARVGRAGKRPVVLTGTVRPGDVLLHTNHRNEEEVVPARVFDRHVWTVDRTRIESLAVEWTWRKVWRRKRAKLTAAL